MLFPFLRPALPDPEKWTPYLKLPYEHWYFSNFGPLATRLADQMGNAYLTEGYGVLCASNSAGLVIALQALDV
ncbi:hypothetical protein [Pseudophaeobacter sp.]|uniref:hypothetical protein n=1 Tax=Pseudophaeobacter sp. TaxID=1971739 RepID=UPI0040580F8E